MNKRNWSQRQLRLDWLREKLRKVCERKVRFETEAAAYQKGQSSYRCGYCGGWHRATVRRNKKTWGFTMYELRIAVMSDDNLSTLGGQLQYRTRSPLVDAGGAFCDFGPWSDWRPVEMVVADHIKPGGKNNSVQKQ